ncbi:hypothetical protein A2U01_0035587 [Trifolium medium]|uniref:Uncharacterized protein n=1 Tax=Trifolium medium TaxID=97028 RepID=A0A392PT31_9FABA|nr:hypothetical protein [Trifolium medium]
MWNRRQNNPYFNAYNLGGKNHMNFSYGANSCLTQNKAFPQDQQSEEHLAYSFEDSLILAMKMTQGNFEAMKTSQEAMKASQETSNKNHEASIKNLEVQMSQLSRQFSNVQNSGGFGGNTQDNPKKKVVMPLI